MFVLAPVGVSAPVSVNSASFIFALICYCNREKFSFQKKVLSLLLV